MSLPCLRPALLALCGLTAFVQPSLAHPLPGSTLTLSRDNDSLDLSITIPLHELALAMPQIATPDGPPEGPPEGPLAADVIQQLTGYFADHLALSPADHSALPLHITSAAIAGANHEDIGHYDLIVVDLAAPLPSDQTLFPLTLRYDAVMHEVRNHTATVFWQAPDQTPIALGEIRFDLTLGAAKPLVLPAQP